MFKTHKYFLPTVDRRTRRSTTNGWNQVTVTYFQQLPQNAIISLTFLQSNLLFPFPCYYLIKKIRITQLCPQIEPTSLAFVYYQQWRLENLQTRLHSCTEGKDNERAWRKINEILGLHAYSHWVRRVHSVRDSEVAGFDDTAWSGFFTEVGYLSCGWGFASIYITWHVFSLTLLQTL